MWVCGSDHGEDGAKNQKGAGLLQSLHAASPTISWMRPAPVVVTLLYAQGSFQTPLWAFPLSTHPCTYRHHHLADDGDAPPRAAARGAARRSFAVRLLAARRATAAALLGQLLLVGCLPREQDEWLGARLVGLLADGAHPKVSEWQQAAMMGLFMSFTWVVVSSEGFMHVFQTCESMFCRRR